jgi:ubiquinone biosynthesis protein
MTSLIAQFGPLRPAGVVDLVRRLGPTSIKIGQYLALRPDLIPQDYCDELLKLVDRVPPFPWGEAQQILTEELGRDPAQAFAYFERRPFAAGSLAQVHRARLDDGTEVAVKIQRPGLAAQVAKDVRRLRALARLLERRGTILVSSPREVVEEVHAWLQQEIDFTRELANVQRLWRLARGSAIQRIPRAYAAYSAKRVLTYEYLRGIPASSVLLGLRSGQAVQSGAGGIETTDPRRFARNLIVACYTQIFRYQFFHADLHPGNLLVLDGNNVGFVDFGLCDVLDDTIRANQLRYIAAVYDGDSGRMFKALLEILVPTDDSDFAGLERDFAAEIRNMGGEPASAEAGSTRRSSTALSLIGVMRAARRNRFEVPPRALSMYRALLTAEALASQLGLDDGLRVVGRDFFRELQRDQLFSQLFDRDQLQQFFASTLALARDAPTQVSQIMSDLAEGTLRFKVEVSDSPHVEKTHNRRARLWTCAILSIGVAILLANPRLPDVFGVSLAWPLVGLLIALYFGCFILWRRL